MKSLLKYVAFAILIGLFFYGFDAWANNNTNNAFQTAFNVLIKVFKNLRFMFYVIAAIALIWCASKALTGKMDLKYLAWLGVGLAVVAAADMLINYAIGVKDVNNSPDISFDDSTLSSK